MAGRLSKFGRPALAVFNSHSLLHESGYDGHAIVCHPVLRPERYATKPGTAITLVNLSESKGALLFDQIARFLPGRDFLGVKGGYSPQVEIARPNLTVIRSTRNMRDDVYAKTGILLMPSKAETFGLVAAEAMCSGIPVIAHPTPGLIECLGHAGLYADRDDLDGWIDVISDLGKAKAWRYQSELAKARAAELADDDQIERFVTEMEKLA